MIVNFRSVYVDLSEVIAVIETGCSGVFVMRGGAEIQTQCPPQHMLHEWRRYKAYCGGPECPEKPEGANDFDYCSWRDYE